MTTPTTPGTTPGSTPGPRTPPGAARGDTRQRILDSALHLFAERGYAGTSIRDIAEELAVTKAAVHYHFPVKEQIVAALLDPYLARFRALVADLEGAPRPADPRRLLRALRAVLDDASPLLGILTTDPSVAASCGELQVEGVELGERMAEALVEEGAPRARVLRAHVALGGFFAAWDTARKRGGVTDDDVEVLLDAAVAALG